MPTEAIGILCLIRKNGLASPRSNRKNGITAGLLATCSTFSAPGRTGAARFARQSSDEHCSFSVIYRGGFSQCTEPADSKAGTFANTNQRRVLLKPAATVSLW